MKAMIFAAGFGTRLRPITNTIPKALVMVNGKPLLRIVIDKLIQFGFNEIIVNVHHFADQIIDYLYQNNNFGISIQISAERDGLLDTGGGLLKAAWFFNDGKPFLVHNVDVLTDLNLNDLYTAHCQSDAMATIAVQKRTSNRYLLFSSENKLCGWKNMKTGDTIIARSSTKPLKRFAFNGIHVINPEIFQYPMPQKVFSIIDWYIYLAPKQKICAYVNNNYRWFDIGTLESLEKAAQFII